MPYKIHKIGSKEKPFCVVDSAGKNRGCSPTMAMAKKHMAALYANSKDYEGGPSQVQLDQGPDGSSDPANAIAKTNNPDHSPESGADMANPLDLEGLPAHIRAEAVRLDDDYKLYRNSTVAGKIAPHSHGVDIRVHVADDGSVKVSMWTNSTSDGSSHYHWGDQILEALSDEDVTIELSKTPEMEDMDIHGHSVTWKFSKAQEKAARSKEKAGIISAEQPPSPTILHREKFDFPMMMEDMGDDGFRTLLFEDGAGVLCRLARKDHRSSIGFFAPLQFSNDQASGRKLHMTADGLLEHNIFRTGVFMHPDHGLINATETAVNLMIQNFEAGVAVPDTGLPFSIAHLHRNGSAGAHRRLFKKASEFVMLDKDQSKRSVSGWSLMGHTELNEYGIKKIAKYPGRYTHCSAEIDPLYDDVEVFPGGAGKPPVRLQRHWVLRGSTATMSPFVPRMGGFADTAGAKQAGAFIASADGQNLYDAALQKYGSEEAGLAAINAELVKRGVLSR